MVNNKKGDRRERELLDMLVKNGFIVHRIAGSGKGEDAICDLIAIDTNGKVHFIEVKSRKKYYYTKDHIDQLNEVDTGDVEITSQVTGLTNMFRDDKVEDCEVIDKLLEQAPEIEDRGVKVKSVF